MDDRLGSDDHDDESHRTVSAEDQAPKALRPSPWVLGEAFLRLSQDL